MMENDPENRSNHIFEYRMKKTNGEPIHLIARSVTLSNKKIEMN